MDKQSITYYLPSHIIQWVKDTAEKENRHPSQQLTYLLERIRQQNG